MTLDYILLGTLNECVTTVMSVIGSLISKLICFESFF